MFPFSFYWLLKTTLYFNLLAWSPTNGFMCLEKKMQIIFSAQGCGDLDSWQLQLITPFWCHFCTSQSSSCCEEGPILASCFFGPQFDLDSSQIQGVRSVWRDGFVEAVSHMFQSFVRSYSQCYTACHLIEALPYFRGKKIALQCTTYRCHI